MLLRSALRGALERMSLKVKRFNVTESTPHSCEVAIQLPAASIVLWHMSRLPGARVIAKKSWAMTDDFEAYFLYKGRLFVLETPFVNIELSMLGQPGDETLFGEVEDHLKRFNVWLSLFFPLAFARYVFVPFSPPKQLLQAHGQTVK
jgi:hypothetical protein